MNKKFGQVINISPYRLMFLMTCNSEVSCIEVYFTLQNSKHLEVKDK